MATTPPTLPQLQAGFPAGGLGFVTLPASTAPLSVAVRGVIVTTSGNMAIVLADGSDNHSAPIAVVAGQYFWPLQAVSLAASGNTAGLLGVI